MGVHSGKVRSFTKMRLIKFLLPLLLVAASTTAFSQKRIAAYNKLKEVIKEEGPEAADGFIEKLKDEFDFDTLSDKKKAKVMARIAKAKAAEDLEVDEDEDFDDANSNQYSAKRIEAYNRAMAAAKEQLEYAEELMGYEMV